MVTFYGHTAYNDLKAFSIADAVAERFESRLEVGDTIQLGPAALIPGETDGDLLMSAALAINDPDLENRLTEGAPLLRRSDNRGAGLNRLRLPKG